jgi:hypothetical protein
MTNLLQTGSDWLADQLKTHASADVIYEQGGSQVPVKATIGRTVFEVVDEYGLVEKYESRDFLIHTADLVLAAVEILPKRGDRIRETQGANAFVYEVMAPGKEPHYRFSDPFRKLLRIHTKHVDTEDA